MKQIREAKHHHKETNNKMQRANHPNLQYHQKVHKQVQWCQNLFIRLKVMMMTNGPLWSNLILSCSRNRNNSRKCVKNNLRKRSKKSLISKCNKKDARKNVNRNKVMSILDFNNNRQNCTTKDKEKRKRIIKRKLSLRRRWETDKSRIKIRERKFKKRRKMSSITC